MRRKRFWMLVTLLRVVLSCGFAIVALGLWFLDFRDDRLFSLVTFSVGLVCLVVVPECRPLWTARATFLSPIAWLLAICVVIGILPPSPSQTDIERSGELIIRQLDAYRSAHAIYPETLKAARIVSPRFRCGSFRYERKTPDEFSLVIGDYRLDGFTVWWQPKTKTWYRDT